MSFGKIYIGSSFAIVAAILFVLSEEALFAAIALSAFIHELGHLVAVRLFGGKVEKIYFECTGIKIEYKLARDSYMRALVIAFAGPVAGAVLTFVSAYMHLPLIAGVSIVLTLFNLLPAAVMDGGRMLYAFTAYNAGTEFAEKLVFIVSCVVSLILTIFGLALLRENKGSFNMLLIGVWIFVGSVSDCCKNCGDGV